MLKQLLTLSYLQMARFANDCNNRLQQLVHALERTLGPDTSDLACRIGKNDVFKQLVTLEFEYLIKSSCISHLSQVFIAARLPVEFFEAKREGSSFLAIPSTWLREWNRQVSAGRSKYRLKQPNFF